jgi:hypothetical protein
MRTYSKGMDERMTRRQFAREWKVGTGDRLKQNDTEQSYTLVRKTEAKDIAILRDELHCIQTTVFFLPSWTSLRTWQRIPR